MILLSIIFIFLTGFVSADFELGNISHEIEISYAPESNLKGWINISFINEPVNSVFEDSLENSISLLELLNFSEFSYDCLPADCETDYTATEPSLEKRFLLKQGEKKIFGFVLDKEITDVNSISFVLQSNATAYCYNQVKIDFFNQGEILKGNNKSKTTGCSNLKKIGCFNSSKSLIESPITETPFCQRIELSESAGFEIGSWIKQKQAGNKKIFASLYDKYGTELTSCEIDKSQIDSNGKEVSCRVEKLAMKKQDFYVCIFSDSGNGEYVIRGHPLLEGCGFFGYPIENENSAYQIFAKGLEFDSVGDLLIEDELTDGNYISDFAEDYILEKYGDLDCSESSCVVPIKILSNKDQEITLKNLKLIYSTPGFPSSEENKFYNVSESSAKINSDFQKLFLYYGNFTLPEKFGEITYSLRFADKKLFSKKILIEKVPIINGITPTKTFAGFPTKFKAIIESERNISKYEWDFGDGETGVTSESSVSHIYNSTGTYEIKISATDNLGKNSYKIFDIKVGSPEEIINQTIKTSQEDLVNIKNEIKKLNIFEQEQIFSALDLEEKEKNLKQIQTNYASANTDDEFVEIMSSLLELKIPKSIVTTKSANNYLFYPQKEKINLEILNSIRDGEYVGKEDEYLNAILSWDYENLNSKINFREYSAEYESYKEAILDFVEVNLEEQNNINYNYYFIIENSESLEFQENYLKSEIENYFYIELDKDTNKIGFSISPTNIESLPFFISPELNRLEIGNANIPEPEPEKFPWIIFIITLGIIIVVGFIVYFFLQKWYDTKYENYLFKDKNQLYNLINYVQNSSKQNIQSEEMKKRLKKIGWSSEQIEYIMKKYYGKNTGLPWFSQNKKINYPIKRFSSENNFRR